MKAISLNEGATLDIHLGFYQGKGDTSDHDGSYLVTLTIRSAFLNHFITKAIKRAEAGKRGATKIGSGAFSFSAKRVVR